MHAVGIGYIFIVWKIVTVESTMLIFFIKHTMYVYNHFILNIFT